MSLTACALINSDFAQLLVNNKKGSFRLLSSSSAYFAPGIAALSLVIVPSISMTNPTLAGPYYMVKLYKICVLIVVRRRFNMKFGIDLELDSII